MPYIGPEKSSKVNRLKITRSVHTASWKLPQYKKNVACCYCSKRVVFFAPKYSSRLFVFDSFMPHASTRGLTFKYSTLIAVLESWGKQFHFLLGCSESCYVLCKGSQSAKLPSDSAEQE